MPLAAGTRLGPYEIAAPLGAGGMGEVYRARDTRLGREVAIKGLPEAFAQNPERLARFEREARLLASLNHPNIAGIFGLEDAAGTPYLVLELVEGETLAQRLARGPLSVRETLEVCGQIAGAIETAHERAIVHRDLKPGNVMLTPSRTVKVLDFGLAKGGATESGSSADFSVSPTLALSATGAGVILGTASYMSPEQARGQNVDRRTDVWALGCLLFECLVGRQAFAGETVSDVIARILERDPEWNVIPAGVPARLREVVRRCLIKNSDGRPRDIGDLRRELSAIAQELSSVSGIQASPATAPSLAVLYFENLASDKESEYFCAGITEDILTDLSKIKGLKVASRNAVGRYRGAPTDIPKVAAELGVQAVLEGSVRRAGDRVRISAQLINASDGFHLWAERYDRTLADVFAVQEEIASSIASALRVALTPAESERLVEDRPKEVRAYDLYLKGRERYGSYTDQSLHEALELFQEATAADPGYALAWAGIADCYGQLCQWGKEADLPELTRLGLEAARRAISLNPRVPEAYKAEALNLRFAGDLAACRSALIKALEVNPRFLPALIKSRGRRHEPRRRRGCRALHSSGARSRPSGPILDYLDRLPHERHRSRRRDDRRVRAFAEALRRFVLHHRLPYPEGHHLLRPRRSGGHRADHARGPRGRSAAR
ncbi:MAG: protein kinase [Candidatus Eisenbacteria bacterium]|uniref:Protein kinase n=1 Tax=Eiseniibacteriota bacterium TaxID=2212470 RepID=A0A538TMN6_UNCEI|nr:MAG: protein kinase [Candidatus Eisenbacteria bacterium]